MNPPEGDGEVGVGEGQDLPARGQNSLNAQPPGNRWK